MFGLGELENATHHYEDLLKQGYTEQKLQRELADYLLAGLDELKVCLNQNKKFKHSLKSIDDFQQGSAEKVDINQVPEKTEGHFITTPKMKEQVSFGLAFVIEDEDDIRKYMVKKLNQDNILTVDYDDAHKALNDVAELKPDIIITDLKMPKMNGMEFITELRKNHPQVPVIIASAYVTKEVCIQALAHGASGIIEKPFEAKDLLAMTKINIMRYKSYKLLNLSLRHMQFQFSDLMNFLTQVGQHDRRDILQSEFQTILVEKRKLDKFTL